MPPDFVRRLFLYIFANKFLKNKNQKPTEMKKLLMMLACMLTTGMAQAEEHWVGTWATAPQLVERHNNPPQPGLTGNSLREIVQVSIGGKRIRLKLTNEFSNTPTEIKDVE